ncbi:MAG: uracil-DNA glycosylase [Mariniphaga sp.]|nr:uracil-DNA glycosylase [Mariniphaga sp.]
MNIKFLQNINIHPDWNSFLSENIKGKIVEIENEIIKSDFTPDSKNVLRFLSVPLSNIKIVIIGQDPYPQPGVATGRAFEVGSLKSWSEPFNNISLKNILRAIYKAYSGEVIKYNQLKTKFDNEFPMLPPGKLFSSWEDQGVLLLNTYFTCQTGIPGSHKHIWEEFSFKLFEFINSYNSEIIWFLWGNHAKESAANLVLKNTIQIMHPMMCFDKPGRDTDFLYGSINCFEKSKNLINWTGYKINDTTPPSQLLF